MATPARCPWCGDDPLYVAYHDQEWGVPCHDDRRLFEFLVLEGAQAGLAWITILRKRENYRHAFAGFDPTAVARWNEADIQRLLAENPFLPGAPELLRALKRHGVTVALVSAGFTLNTDPIMAEFGLDYALANELTARDGILDGGAINRTPEGGKAAFARSLMARLDVAPEQTLAAGDTHGDLELFDCAGVRIAVNPKSDLLRARADVVFEPDLLAAVAWLTTRGYLG
jgi:HAD superfamily phosphoserine phosphatase-like hydrolase